MDSSASPANPEGISRFFRNPGLDIKILGVLFLVSGCIDLAWILSYPQYSLTVFGTTFSGIAGEIVKLQHPLIHWIIGYGFLKTRNWAFMAFLLYLGLACVSEITTQVVEGYHPMHTTMIGISLLFGAYLFARRNVFSSP